MYNYVCTAQRATAVSHSVTGNFTGPKEINLIISKGTRIEIHQLTEEGVQPLLDIGIYGRITNMFLFRPKGANQDHLFISTESYQFCVLRYENNTIITTTNGDIKDRVGKPVEIGHIVIIDPSCSMILMHLYDRTVKILPIDKNNNFESTYNLRIEELTVIDIKFLEGYDLPTIAILYQDHQDSRHIKTYQITHEQKLEKGPIFLANVEANASMLIPVSKKLGGGFLVVGEKSIAYKSQDSEKSVVLNPTMITSYGSIDSERFLLGDISGALSVLSLKHSQGKLLSMSVEKIGDVSTPSTISYLDNGFVFVGSSYSNSQLIKMKEEKDEEGSFIEVFDEYINIGPILDFCSIDLERQGQCQLVTCSGGFNEGSLRVINNGIGIEEQATIGLEGMKGLWSMKETSDSEHDKYLAVSFLTETRFLSIEDEELEETEIDGFDMKTQTIYCGNFHKDFLIQITNNGISVVNSKKFGRVCNWSPNDNKKINLVGCNNTQICISQANNISFFEMKNNTLSRVAQKTLENEIACIDVTPLEGNTTSDVVAVGMWTSISVNILKLPTLELLSKIDLGGDAIPRSLLFSTFDQQDYLFVGMGDGNLFNFRYNKNNHEFTERKKVVIASQPITLQAFNTENGTNIFAASDRPTVIYSSNKKILYSNVNLNQVRSVAPFNASSFPGSLALAVGDDLTIGTIDAIQKLDIRTIKLPKETPRRICYQPSSNTFGLITLKTNGYIGVDDTSFFKLLNAQTFEEMSKVQLENYEYGSAVLNTKLGTDDKEYFILGTAVAAPGDTEPSEGRVLVYKVDSGRLEKVFELKTKGTVYNLMSFKNKLVAAVFDKVCVYNWVKDDEQYKLELETTYQGFQSIVFMKNKGDFIIVADLMKSVSVLRYKGDEKKIEEVARDYDPNWMTSLEILNDDVFLGTENNFNFFTVSRNNDAVTEEEKCRLQLCGQYHFGEYINKIEQSSIVMKIDENSKYNTFIFASVNGTIGVIASISEEEYIFFQKLTQNITKVIKGVGGFEHSHWRSFKNERKSSESKGFIDGDLIESFLDLNNEQMEQVVEGLEISVEDLCRKIETLAHALH